MPCHPCDREHHYVVMSSCVSTQIPHAVGIAMAMKIAGDAARCASATWATAARSEGDFHVALNFAGVMKRAVRADLPEQPVGDLDAGPACRPPPRRSRSRARLRRRGAARRRQRRARGLRRRRVRRRQGAPRRRPDVRRAAHLPRQRALVVGRSDALSRREGHRGVAGPARSAAPHRGVPAQRAAGSRPASARRSRRSSRPTCATRSRAQEAVGAPALETLIDDVFEEPTWNLREQLAELVAARPRAKSPHSALSVRQLRHCDTTSGATPLQRTATSAARSWHRCVVGAYMKRMRRFSRLALSLAPSLLLGLRSQARAHPVDGAVLGRVVIYRNGVAFYERTAKVVDGQRHGPRAARSRRRLPQVADRRRPGHAQAARGLDPAPGGRRRQLPDDDARDADRASGEVLLTYVTESPAWKPSYRVVVGTTAR